MTSGVSFSVMDSLDGRPESGFQSSIRVYEIHSSKRLLSATKWTVQNGRLVLGSPEFPIRYHLVTSLEAPLDLFANLTTMIRSRHVPEQDTQFVGLRFCKTYILKMCWFSLLQKQTHILSSEHSTPRQSWSLVYPQSLQSLRNENYVHVNDKLVSQIWQSETTNKNVLNILQVARTTSLSRFCLLDRFPRDKSGSQTPGIHRIAPKCT